MLAKLTGSTPPGFKFRLTFCLVNDVNPKGVRKKVLTHLTKSAGEKVPLHDVDANGKEMFSIGVVVIAFNANVCQTRVGMMVVYPLPKVKKEGEEEGEEGEGDDDQSSSAAGDAGDGGSSDESEY